MLAYAKDFQTAALLLSKQERDGLLTGNKNEMQELFDKRSKMEADFMERWVG